MSNKKGIIWGTVIGTAVGAVTALLLAPKSGKELRGDIADTAQLAAEKTQKAAESVQQGTNQLVKTIGSSTAAAYDKAKTFAVSVTDSVKGRRKAEVSSTQEAPEAIEAVNAEENIQNQSSPESYII